jgi:hypothetical protein
LNGGYVRVQEKTKNINKQRRNKEIEEKNKEKWKERKPKSANHHTRNFVDGIHLAVHCSRHKQHYPIGCCFRKRFSFTQKTDLGLLQDM